MKFFIVALALFAVAATAPSTKPAALTAEQQQIAQIIEAIYSPNTDPNTAVALEALLQDLVGSDVAVGPAIVEVAQPEPIAVGPAFVEVTEPVAVGPVFAEVGTSPAAVGAVETSPVASPTPLVQIILNINAATSPAAVVEATPVESVVAETPIVPEAVAVPITPEVVGVAFLPETVAVAALPETVAVAALPETVAVAALPETVVVAALPETIAVAALPETVAVAALPEAVAVAEPIVVSPVVALPEILN